MLNYRISLILLLFFSVYSCHAQEGLDRDLPRDFPFANRRPAPQFQPGFISPHVSRGTTVLGGDLMGVAAALAGQGSYVESVSRANRNNAIAEGIRIENQAAIINLNKERVQAYYDLRRLNQEWRREQNPPAHIRDLKANNLKESIIREQPEFFTENREPSQVMNWLLGKLTEKLIGNELVASNDSGLFGGGFLEAALAPQDFELVYIQSTSKIDGNHVRMKLSEMTTGEVRAPYFFQRDEIQSATKSYIGTRQRFVDDLRDRNYEPTYEDYKRLYDSLDSLRKKFLEVYHPAKRDPSVLRYETDYHAGQRFFKSQVAAITYTQRTRDPKFMIGSDQFEGKSLGQLLHFMTQNGYEFARPELVVNNSYKKLFQLMRQAYIQ